MHSFFVAGRGVGVKNAWYKLPALPTADGSMESRLQPGFSRPARHRRVQLAPLITGLTGVTIVANRLDRAAFFGFFTARFFLRVFRLFIDE